MLYTRKGDTGNTGTFRCDQRISKSSATAEALGALDEINSFLGLAKVKSGEQGLVYGTRSFSDIIHEVQENLFTIQAEVAGAEKTTAEEKVRIVEAIVDGIEKELPPITSFLISGGTELTALLDTARTFARRAERRVIAVHEEGKPLGPWTLAYLNRLSSLLYALARLTNKLCGITERAPSYK